LIRRQPRGVGRHAKGVGRPGRVPRARNVSEIKRLEE
jgi:hypothetical protein